MKNEERTNKPHPHDRDPLSNTRALLYLAMILLICLLAFLVLDWQLGYRSETFWRYLMHVWIR